MTQIDLVVEAENGSKGGTVVIGINQIEVVC